MNIKISNSVPQSNQDKICDIIEQITMSKSRIYVENDKFNDSVFCKKLFNKQVKMDHTADVWNRIMIRDSQISNGEVNKIKTKTLIFTKPQEILVFLQMNYARHRTVKIAKKAKETLKLTPKEAESFLTWHNIAEDIRNTIVLANMGLVRSMTKNYINKYSSIEFESISYAVEAALYRTIRSFDVSRGFRFSTYACMGMYKSRGGAILKIAKARETICSSENTDEYGETPSVELQNEIIELRDILKRQRANLTIREAKVLQSRYWRGDILEDVGKNIFTTKERARQVIKEAEAKIRAAMTGEDFKIINKPNKHPYCKSLISTEEHLLIEV